MTILKYREEMLTKLPLQILKKKKFIGERSYPEMNAVLYLIKSFCSVEYQVVNFLQLQQIELDKVTILPNNWQILN